MFKLLLVLLFTTPSFSHASEKVCTSIRGNGFHIAAHFGALARVTEDLGPVEALSTSSSGASSAFIYDSLSLNPLMKDKNSNTCDTIWCRERMSFLIKSIPLYLEALYESETMGRDMRAFVSELEFLKSLAGGGEETDEDKVQKEVENDDKEVSNAAFIAMALLFQHDDIRGVIRPSYYQKIGLDPIKGRLDLWSMDFKQAKLLLNFLFNYKFPDFRVFSRDGLVNFEYMVEILGVGADYYRAYDPNLQKT